MDFTSITVGILKNLSEIAGSYGLAIIFLTVIVRLAMWPLSVSQQRSMKKMQTLTPKMKEIQNRYKNDPQVMQKKMMEFYKEHSFNPLGGCFPLLLQMPVFILLYTALISPQFIEVAGQSSFLFINRLDAPIRSHSAVVNPEAFGVAQNDTFSLGKVAKVTFEGGTTEEVKVDDYKRALKIQGELKPGENLDLKLNLDNLKLPFSKLDKVQSAELTVVNNATKAVKHLTFKRNGPIVVAQVPTEEVQSNFNWDVFALVILFGVTMYLSQKIMMATNKNASMDPSQQAMQQMMGNMMPFMITAMFIFFPIPAGVLLYMVVSNMIQVAQTVIINKQIDMEEQTQKQKIDDSKVQQAKPVNNKKK